MAVFLKDVFKTAGYGYMVVNGGETRPSEKGNPKRQNQRRFSDDLRAS
ncbi:hypothetical protein [Neisseria chenwenguii]|nr:hypothetical protein [Neisseria chenwenguii]